MAYPGQVTSVYPFIPPPYIPPPINTSAMISQNSVSANELTSKNNAFDRPITTVFIGNISEKIPDTLMKDILTKCGNVLSWKRVQGASKLQAFGFCEYDNPEATLRCIRLLNEFKIADKALVVKVDPKTDELLTEYKNKKKQTIEDREADDISKTEEARKERIIAIYAKETDEDKSVLKQIKKLIVDSGHYEGQSDDSKPKKSNKSSKKRELSIDADLDPEKKQIISKEIETFRNKHKDEDIIEDEERYKRIREREKEKRKEKEREKSSDKHKRRRNKSRSKSRSNFEVESRRRSRDSSMVSKKRRSASKDTHKSSKKVKRENEKDIDEYEAAMLKKLERKLREKEAAYQTRLQLWESREKKRLKEYDSESDRKIQKDREISEEARKLQIFFEDYDDEKWDLKYYRGAELERRLNSRRMEESSDEKDRLKEVEQIDNTRERLIKEQNPDVEDIISKMEQSMQEHLQKKLVLENVPVKLTTLNGTHEPMEETIDEIVYPENNNIKNVIETEPTSQPIEKIDGDNECSTIETVEPLKHITESNMETSEDKVSNISLAERKVLVKKIIDNIPTVKVDLFAYPIDWTMVDQSFVDSRIKPWVKKKIVAYIGEDEPSLSQFICDQVLDHKTPDQILADIAMVLEEEADVFVMKMWRLLIYVIEERKAGLDN